MGIETSAHDQASVLRPIDIPSSIESVVSRITNYLPSEDILAAYPQPTPLDLERQKMYQEKRPGCDYALVAHKGKMLIVPAGHPLNTEAQISHATQYGTAMFEGGSEEPVANEEGQIVGANAILVKPRMDRMFHWSLPGRPGIQPPVDREVFEQATLDYVAILGIKPLVSQAGLISRAYLRPSIAPGEGALGIGIKDQTINMGVEAWNWPSYFPDAERVYQGTGIILAAGPNQRLQALHGKHASNYGDAARVGNLARYVGADEALYFAPYPVNKDGSQGREVVLDYHKGDPNLGEIMKKLALADGPGEEIMAVTRDGKILLPPMNVNRLGGTTAAYIMDHMASRLGLVPEIRPFNLNELAHEGNPDGKITGLFFAGNASRIAPIGEIRLHGFEGERLGQYHLPIPDIVRQLVDRYEGEVRGIIPPSHSSLLTPIDLANGRIAREILDRVYAEWFR